MKIDKKHLCEVCGKQLFQSVTIYAHAPLAEKNLGKTGIRKEVVKIMGVDRNHRFVWCENCDFSRKPGED